jgi:hypothetical protein
MITLHIDEDDYYRHSTIAGRLDLDGECQRWRINSDVLYDPKELARMAKANEFLFANREEWVELVSCMMRFESNVQVSLKDIKETNGDLDRALKVTVSNKVIKAFKLKTRIFGTKRHEYTVELGAEFTGHQVKFYLDSADLAFMIAKQSEELLNENVKAFKDSGVPIIHT